MKFYIILYSEGRSIFISLFVPLKNCSRAVVAAINDAPTLIQQITIESSNGQNFGMPVVNSHTIRLGKF